MRALGEAQKSDNYVRRLAQQSPNAMGEFFEDIGKKSGPNNVLTQQDPKDPEVSRIIVPQDLTKCLIEWHHTNLVHPGVERSHNALRQHCPWPRMLADIRAHLKKCGPCQKVK